MDVQAYFKMLNEALMPLLEREYMEKDDFILFQQDHAACHTVKVTHDYFVSAAIHFSPVGAEESWHQCHRERLGFLVRCGYVGYRQFESSDDLKEALMYELEQIDLDYIRKLVQSMPRRCAQLIRSHGDLTWY